METPTLLQRTYVFDGRVFRVRQDRIRMPDGREVTMDIVEHRGAVAMLPVDEQGRIWFVWQYRHAIEKVILEIPAGTLEEGENPLLCAQRELREEIGFQAASWALLGKIYPAPGYTSEHIYIYLAQDLTPAPLARDGDELLEPVAYAWPQVRAMLEKGEIEDAKTLVALLLAQGYLEATWKDQSEG